MCKMRHALTLDKNADMHRILQVLREFCEKFAKIWQEFARVSRAELVLTRL